MVTFPHSSHAYLQFIAFQNVASPSPEFPACPAGKCAKNISVRKTAAIDAPVSVQRRIAGTGTFQQIPGEDPGRHLCGPGVPAPPAGGNSLLNVDVGSAGARCPQNLWISLFTLAELMRYIIEQKSIIPVGDNFKHDRD